MAELEFPDEEVDDDIEPESPSIENVVFVLLGALATLGVVYHVATLFG